MVMPTVTDVAIPVAVQIGVATLITSMVIPIVALLKTKITRARREEKILAFYT